MTEARNRGAMTGKPYLSMRLLIPLVIMLTMLLVLAFLYRHSLELETEQVYHEYQTRQLELAVGLQGSVEREMRAGDMASVQNALSELGANPEVRVALLADAQGRVIASSRLAMVGRTLDQVESDFAVHQVFPGLRPFDQLVTIHQQVSREHHALLVRVPVRLDIAAEGLNISKAGLAVVYSDIHHVLLDRRLHVRTQMQNLAASLCALALLIGLLLHWVITRRIVRLFEASQRVAAGDLAAVSQVVGGDEIGRLGHAFDAMVEELARSTEQVRKLSRAVEQSPNSIIITDPEGVIEYVNSQFCRISGYVPEEVVGKTMRMHQSGVTPIEVYEELWRTIKAGQTWQGELLNKSKAGKLYWEQLSISPIFDEQGRITHFLSEQIDITSRKQAEEQIRLFEKVFANANEAILISDANNRILSVNPAFTELTGYTAAEVIGRNPSMFASGQMDADFYREMWASLEANGKWQGEVVDRRKNGELFAEWLSISAVRDDSARLTHYIALMSDISERKAAEERMTYLAQHDVLTGLPNRMLFQDRLLQAITYAERQQSNVALLFLDLDRFKNVNDTLGHQVGDQLLQEVTRRIRECVRSSDTVSRQGGDEFVIMLPNLGELGDILPVVNKLIESIASPYELAGHVLHITTSVGVSVYPQDGSDIETLIKHADTAMYQAKEAGRNGYRFFTTEMNRAVARRVGLENKLRGALKRGELLLHYQPQVDLVSGQVIAAEALVRWQHPEEGLIAPVEFIPIAEETGMIVPIGEWVLNEACRQNQEWRNMGLRDIVVAVNLSPLQFQERNLTETISAALSRSGMPASALELEITESAMMKNPQQAIDMLNKINGLGIKVSIDDFGTGYSNLANLKHFPLDKLKIDQSFVHDLSTNNDDAAIVSAVISMAKSLKLRVIAEGVETIEQLRFLEKLSCDKIQGYHFSKPLPADEFGKLLASGRMLSRFLT